MTQTSTGLTVLSKSMSMSMSMSMSATSTAGMSPGFMVGANVTYPGRRVRMDMGRKKKGESISIRCQVGLDSETERKIEMVGRRIRVKKTLKVYHVPRVGEVELPAGTEGCIKQYVGFWKGKRISANLPFKVEFHTDVPERGPVKFMAHLDDDEFDLI